MDEDSCPHTGNHRKNHQMNPIVSDRVGQMCVQYGFQSTQGQTLNLNLKQIPLQWAVIPTLVKFFSVQWWRLWLF